MNERRWVEDTARREYKAREIAGNIVVGVVTVAEWALIALGGLILMIEI